MSGEEHALRGIAGVLGKNGHHVSWFLRSSAGIQGIQGRFWAFFSGLYSPGAVRGLQHFLTDQVVDVALVQNLYPLLSPSIIPVFSKFDIPVVMRCPNYRLFCPNGLHLCHGQVCERCLFGREYWCILNNCENNLFKSTGYALRNAAARISRKILDNVNVFVVLSEFQRQRFVDAGIPPERIAIVPNIAPAVTGTQANGFGHLVSFVGRVSPEKGVEDFTAAAAQMPEIPFAIAGNPEQMPELVESTPRNVQWMGFLTGNNLDEFFHQSRVLVFPGKWFEGFPNVITQAMMTGRPVIASRLGAIPEIVEHEKTGLLFEPGNIKELVACIHRLYENPDECKEMGQAGRKKAETQYSCTEVYSRLMKIFKNLV